MKDQMTPMERAIDLSKGQLVDRLPCNPYIANGVARIHGCKISEFKKVSRIHKFKRKSDGYSYMRKNREGLG